MLRSENRDIIFEICNKTMGRGVATESDDNYCEPCYKKLAYGNKKRNLIKSLFENKRWNC
ncbi:hypothetical protein P4268_28625 [Bacillus thuringiensis]|nr:hypothetical protein [Bacillus thuringiensis]